MSAPLKRNRSTPSEFVPVDESAGDLLDHHQYMDGSLPPGIRPAKWSMEAVRAELESMAEDERWDGNTRYVSLRSVDSDYHSTIPTMWATIHWLKPGERIDMHRHTPGSLYYIIQGRGYSTIDHYRIDWEAGDTFSCPSYSWHEHWNTGDEVALIWTVQDLPSYSYNRMVSFQSGDSDEMSFLHEPKG